MTETRWNIAKDYLVYWVARLAITVLSTFSRAMALWTADLFGWLLSDVFKIRRKITLDNLRAAYPEWTEAKRRETCRAMWRHLVLLVIETVQLGKKVHDTNWRDYVTVRGGGKLVKRFLDDRPLIVVSAHFGHFEMASVMCGLLGLSMHAVARAFDNPFVGDYLNRIRTQTGQQVIPKTGGFDWIVDVLAAKGAVAFLADQNAGDKGCPAKFFGRPASAHKSIALLSLQFDAPIVIGYCRRVGEFMKYELCVGEVLDPRTAGPELRDVKRITQWYTDRIEEFVRLSPEQYWWLHDRWKPSKRTGAKPAKPTAVAAVQAAETPAQAA